MKRLILISALGGCLTLSALAQEQERTLSADSIVTTDKRLDSLYRNLPEVMVVGRRPVVKAEAGKLVYDLPRLIKEKPVNNIYEALKYLPGVTEQDGSITLSGQTVTVILDGKVSSMSAEQLYTLLQSMPADRIASVEVMYNAPARYRVRGALINITLRRATAEHLQGELFGEYRQQHNAAFTERASLLYGNHKWSLDLLYRHGHGDTFSTTEKEARHTLNDGSLTEILTSERTHRDYTSHAVRLGLDYMFGKQHNASLVYNFQEDNSDARILTDGFLQARTLTDGAKHLHNLRMDYHTPIGIQAGAEMTYYESPTEQDMNSSLQGVSVAFFTTEMQRINRWNFYVSGEHTLSLGWGINYGGGYQTSIDHSSQTYRGEGELPEGMRSRRREETTNFYVGANKSFGKRFNIDFSLELEHYKSVVWNEWDFYPTLNASYTPRAGHIFQLAFNTGNDYPEYWAVQNATTYLNAYSEIQGNPELKPHRIYDASLTYIHKGRYIFRTWITHMDDYGVQTLYQSPERLVEIYRYLNFDYWQQVGIMASLPLRVGKWLDARFNLMAIRVHQKDSDFYELPFDRKRWLPMLTAASTWTLSRKPDLKLQVDGRLQGRALQATYDLPASGSLDVALRYAFDSGKGTLKLAVNDLLATSQIDPRIRYASQWVTNDYSCYTRYSVSFAYRFGGYKEKKRADVDTSRFK